MWEKKNIMSMFAINYRAFINGRWHEVYRIDNYHGFLHEQRFWQGPKPIPLDTHVPLDIVINEAVDNITENFRRYRRYYEQKLKEEDG